MNTSSFKPKKKSYDIQNSKNNTNIDKMERQPKHGKLSFK